MSHTDTRFTKSKKSGSPHDQGEGGAGRSRPTTSKRGGMIDANVKGSTRGSRDNTTPVRAHVAGPRTAERGGHNRVGHDRVNPSAGKSKSGSKSAQHPNVKRGTSRG